MGDKAKELELKEALESINKYSGSIKENADEIEKQAKEMGTDAENFFKNLESTMQWTKTLSSVASTLVNPIGLGATVAGLVLAGISTAIQASQRGEKDAFDKWAKTFTLSFEKRRGNHCPRCRSFRRASLKWATSTWATRTGTTAGSTAGSPGASWAA